MTTLADIGPQYERDDAFTARMRFHQSWYRAAVLGLPMGERKGKRPRPLGSMLRTEDGDAGKNFLSDAIFDVVGRRIAQGGGVSVRRALCNLLSSQPMCFNLFGPLVDDHDLATRLCRKLWPDVHKVTNVVIEWAPKPASEYLADRTSFDAFIEYEREDRSTAFCGIETKLTEPFSQDHYDKPEYRRWMGEGSPWKPEAHDHVADVAHNQLWRNHLLAWSMLRHPASTYAAGRCAVVRHPSDARCSDVLRGYDALLGDRSTLQDLPIDQVVSAWRAEPGVSEWLDKFACRYLELDKSEALWTEST